MSVEELGGLYRSVVGAPGDMVADSASQLERVQEFLVLQKGLRPHKIKPHSQIERDFKISGDEARKLMKSYADSFGVDMLSFDADRYFSKRSGFLRKWEDMLMVFISLACVALATFTLWVLLLPLLIAVSWNVFFAARAPQPLTVQMLADIAESRKWPPM